MLFGDGIDEAEEDRALPQGSSLVPVACTDPPQDEMQHGVFWLPPNEETLQRSFTMWGREESPGQLLCGDHLPAVLELGDTLM